MAWLSPRGLSAILLLLGSFRSTSAAAQLPLFSAEAPHDSEPPSEAPLAPTPPVVEEALPAPPPAPPGAATKPLLEGPAAPGLVAGVRPARVSLEQQRLAPRSTAPELEADLDADEPVRPRRRWYGWQTLSADGAALLLALSAVGLSQGSSADTTALSVPALLGYEFAPGVIHFAHGNPGRAFASMGVRLGVPLAAAFVGATAASGCDDYGCEAGGAAVGFLLGIGGAMAIDAAVFAYDEQSPPPTARTSLLPLVSVTSRGAVLGLAGTL